MLKERENQGTDKYHGSCLPQQERQQQHQREGCLISSPLVSSSLRYPKIVKHARRESTRKVLGLALESLEQRPKRTGSLNVSSLAKVSGYHRRTVARALAFGVMVRVLQEVKRQTQDLQGNEHQQGTPTTYRSLFKLTTAKRAPSLKKPFKVQASASKMTGLAPSRRLRSAAMIKIRGHLERIEQTRLLPAYGKYVWSKSATVVGISHLVRNWSVAVTPRTPTMGDHDAFSLAISNIFLACRSLDRTERYCATLVHDPPQVSWRTFLRKPTPANTDAYVGMYKSVNEVIDLVSESRVSQCENAPLSMESVSSSLVSSRSEWVSKGMVCKPGASALGVDVVTQAPPGALADSNSRGSLSHEHDVDRLRSARTRTLPGTVLGRDPARDPPAKVDVVCNPPRTSLPHCSAAMQSSSDESECAPRPRASTVCARAAEPDVVLTLPRSKPAVVCNDRALATCAAAARQRVAQVRPVAWRHRSPPPARQSSPHGFRWGHQDSSCPSL